MVPERREGSGEDMFSQICRTRDDDGEYMSVEAIVDHMNFLMMAEDDTITSSITTLVWELARHPEWKDRLREEKLSDAPAGEGAGHNSLGQPEMTASAFKEELRLVPTGTSLPCRTHKELEYGGYRYPGGNSE